MPPVGRRRMRSCRYFAFPGICSHLHGLFINIQRSKLVEVVGPARERKLLRVEARGEAHRSSCWRGRRRRGRTMSSRPNRSDAHLPPEEEARLTEETREYFDGIAPKRHSKPQRSEHSDRYSDALPPTDGAGIPELDRFRDLEADTGKLVCEGSEPKEEFVETEYYKELGCVDKQHHTTGTGFIRVEKPNGDSSNLTSDHGTHDCHPSCRGNPATNEWVPSTEMDIPTSQKPSRSDI